MIIPKYPCIVIMMKVASIVEQNICHPSPILQQLSSLKYYLSRQQTLHIVLFSPPWWDCPTNTQTTWTLIKCENMKTHFDKSLTHSYLLTNACTQLLTCTIHNDFPFSKFSTIFTKMLLPFGSKGKKGANFSLFSLFMV